MARTAAPMGVRACSTSEARIDRWRTPRQRPAADAVDPAWRASPCPLGWCSARDNGSPEQEAR